MDELHVFLNDAMIGVLTQDGGEMSFRYAPEYLQRRDAYPLSLNLPLTAEVFQEPVTENFFSNLLPDERIRDTIALILHVSRDNTFRLLREIGADCAGAVSFYPPGESPQSEKEPVYRELSEDEAYAILDNLGQRPLDVGDEGVRISGAGSQEKLVACVRDGKIALPLYGTPSTHIVKPGIPNFPDSVFNEYFCMKLAAKCGLPVAECDILTVKDEPFYVVKRFDRYEVNGFSRRLHQEDFCQLLNIPPKLKYQEDGGPGVEDCIRQMTTMRLPAIDRLRFVRLLLFNFLIGNCDAHAKNYAILYRDGKPELAPAYDLLSTMVYESMSRKFAMALGGDMRMGMIQTENFDALAESCEMRVQLVRNELAQLATMLPEVANALAGELNAVHPDRVYGRIEWEIRRLCRQVSSDVRQ